MARTVDYTVKLAKLQAEVAKIQEAKKAAEGRERDEQNRQIVALVRKHLAENFGAFDPAAFADEVRVIAKQ